MPAGGTGMTSSPFGDLIYSYSRADALGDGVLIEADPELCRQAGIRWPVALTDHLWGYIEPDNLEEMPGQSVTGRLWDLLWMFTLAARRSGGDRISYRVMFQVKTDKTRPRMETLTVIAACGPGDSGEPVITLMLPEDD